MVPVFFSPKKVVGIQCRRSHSTADADKESRLYFLTLTIFPAGVHDASPNPSRVICCKIRCNKLFASSICFMVPKSSCRWRLWTLRNMTDSSMTACEQRRSTLSNIALFASHLGMSVFSMLPAKFSATHLFSTHCPNMYRFTTNKTPVRKVASEIVLPAKVGAGCLNGESNALGPDAKIHGRTVATTWVNVMLQPSQYMHFGNDEHRSAVVLRLECVYSCRGCSIYSTDRCCSAVRSKKIPGKPFVFGPR